MVFALCLIAYYIIHSLLASSYLKHLLKDSFIEGYYRIWYNLIAVISLLPLIYLYQTAEKTKLFEGGILIKIGSLFFFLMGLFTLIKSLWQYDLREFSGLGQVAVSSDEYKTNLVITGMNAYVRHPLYFAALLIVWSIACFRPNEYLVMTAGITTLYLWVGIASEERKLVKEFGEDYIDYRRKIPMIIPRIGFLKALFQ